MPLPDPEPEDTPITDLVIPADCMAIPLFWRTGELHPLSRHRVKTINVGDLIAYLGDNQPEPFWIAEVTGLRRVTMDVAWYWRDPENDKWRRSRNGDERLPHSGGVWLHWGFELTAQNRIPCDVMACIENHDRFYRRRKYKRRNAKNHPQVMDEREKEEDEAEAEEEKRRRDMDADDAVQGQIAILYRKIQESQRSLRQKMLPMKLIVRKSIF